LPVAVLGLGGLGSLETFSVCRIELARRKVNTNYDAG
jgi:hypothetical protein